LGQQMEQLVGARIAQSRPLTLAQVDAAPVTSKIAGWICPPLRALSLIFDVASTN